MAFVILDANGAIAGMFGIAQNPPRPEGYAEIDDADPRIAVFAAKAAALLNPLRITKRQALLWLLTIDKTEADVLAAIASISDPTARAEAQIAWNYPDSGILNRADPLFDELGPALFGSTYTPAQMDAAFDAAAAL